MTFTDIQSRISDRLNLTSTAALTRIGQSINEAYREMASSVGIKDKIERGTASASTVVGNRDLTFGPSPTKVQKILAVYDPSISPPRLLDEFTMDELLNQVLGTDPASAYAIKLMGATSVTIHLDVIPASIYTLTADVLINLVDLSGTDVPAFAEDFHNLLIYKGMQIELEKMEKYDLAAKQEKKFQDRMGEYRLYIASSAYLKIMQGKDSPENVQRSTPLV